MSDEFDGLDTFFPEEDQAPVNKGSRDNFEDDVYKKWFRTKDRSGFLAIRGWLDAGKISVDVGELGNDGLKGNTQVWANAIDLAVYLRAVYHDKATALYPSQRNTSPEAFVYYGGGQIDGKPVSRILKIEHWSTGSGDKKSYDASAFAWKCGHFAARKTESGAFIPDMSKSLSQNSIKVSRVEMAEISYRIDLALAAFASQEDDAFRALNGNKR